MSAANQKIGVRLALDEAERKEEAGALINCKDEDSQERMDNWDWSNGDFETVHTIESLYSDQFPNEAKEISDALYSKYPSHY